MAQFLANTAKGRLNEFGTLTLTNDAIVWGLLLTAGIEAQSALQDYATVSAMLAAANDEPVATGYARVAHTNASITATLSQSTDDLLIDDTIDPTWTFTGGTIAAISGVWCAFDNDTTAGTDANLVPVFYDLLAASFTPTVNVAFSYVVATGGFARAA